MKKSIICIVDERVKAETIVEQLKVNGFTDGDISVLFPDQKGTHDFAHEHHTKAPEGAVAGVGAGGAIGGTLGLLAGIGALAIPGLGPFIAAGPLLAALSGAAVGAAAGGLTGALVGMGIPEIEAKRFEGKLKGGNILIAAHAEDDVHQKTAENIYKTNHAHDISSMSESSVPR